MRASAEHRVWWYIWLVPHSTALKVVRISDSMPGYSSSSTRGACPSLIRKRILHVEYGPELIKVVNGDRNDSDEEDGGENLGDSSLVNRRTFVSAVSCGEIR